MIKNAVQNKKIDLRGSEISNFIIWTLQNDLSKEGSSDILDSFVLGYRNTVQKYNKYKLAVDFLDKLYNGLIYKLFVRRNENGKKILFNCGIKYPSICLKANKHCKVEIIANGKLDRLFAIKNSIGYINITDLNQLIYNYFIQRDDNYLYELLGRIEKRIKLINPDYIVLSNDFLPIERAIVLVSKKIGIPTIIIQHGIFQSVSLFIDGKVADYILAWGQYFKDLYVTKSFRDPKDVYILGYPYLIKQDKKKQDEKKDIRGKSCYIVYYLGSNFEKYNKNLLNIKLETIREIHRICVNLGMNFIYRCHPGDDREILKNKLPEVFFASPKEKLRETFDRGDVFVSFNSTSLIEAAMRKKVCLQLRNYSLETDNFEEIGVCSKSFKTIKELENYLAKIANSPNLDDFKVKFNNNYVETSYDPGERFLEILDEIRKKS